MGLSILELVLRRLREEKFRADVAFPGQKYPPIREPVAAVHIEKVDRSSLTVTVEVNVICPAEMGGTACELEALRATEVLRWEGAVCVQNGCTYDGMAHVYCVSVLATFNCVTEEDSCTMGPGFQVFLNEVRMPHTTAFTAEEKRDVQLCYEMGEGNPVGIHNGSTGWEIRLEELIPSGSQETALPSNAFTLRLEKRTGFVETYYNCRWNSVKLMFDRNGLKRVCTGLSVMREES